MTYDKETLTEDILLLTEGLNLEKPTVEILDQLETTWSYNPFGKGTYLFIVEVGILSMPTALNKKKEEYLDVDKSYIASDSEIQNTLALLKQCYEEILSFAKYNNMLGEK